MKQADLGLHLCTQRARKRKRSSDGRGFARHPMFRDFAALDGTQRLPDETTIRRFRRLLEDHKLADQTLKLVNDLLGSEGLQGTPATANHSTHRRLA